MTKMPWVLFEKIEGILENKILDKHKTFLLLWLGFLV